MCFIFKFDFNIKIEYFILFFNLKENICINKLIKKKIFVCFYIKNKIKNNFFFKPILCFIKLRILKIKCPLKGLKFQAQVSANSIKKKRPFSAIIHYVSPRPNHFALSDLSYFINSILNITSVLN